MAAALGACTEAVTTVVAKLIPIPEDGCFEFVFSIACTYINEDELSYDVQEREAAKVLIPEPCREHIIPTVLNALERLVEMVQPASIYYVSKTGNLPPKALTKYELITSLLQRKGYVIAESGYDRFCRPFWLMEKQ